MPSLLPPLPTGLDAPGSLRATPLRPGAAKAEFADTLNRSRREAPQPDAVDAPVVAEPPRQDQDPRLQETREAADSSTTAPVDAQGAAQEAQDVPDQQPPAAQTTDAGSSGAQSGAGTDATSQAALAQAQQSAVAAAQMGGRGAPGQSAARAGAPRQPAAPAGAAGSQAAPVDGAHDATEDVAPPEQARPVPHAELKTSTDAGDSTARLSSDQPLARDPALGRALQVQAAIVVENLTGSVPDSAGAKAAASDRAILAGASSALSAGDALPRGAETSAGLVRGLSAMVNHGGGVMTMRLVPPELGQVRVQMTLAQGTVTAHFQPATAEAQAILERTMPALRAALEAHGLVAERLTVQAAPQPAAPAREQQPQQEQPGHDRHQHDAGGGESRGRRDGAPQDQQRRAAWREAQFEFETTRPRRLQGANR